MTTQLYATVTVLVKVPIPTNSSAHISAVHTVVTQTCMEWENKFDGKWNIAQEPNSSIMITNEEI